MSVLQGKRILITGGTGSLGKTLVKRLLSASAGLPERIVVFSRDEAKQHQMRLDYASAPASTDEVVFENFRRRLQFRIGDVRDQQSVANALHDIDIVINAAAMKQVPTCEYFPAEAVQTNVIGANNIINAVHRNRLPLEAIVGVSTDKAVQPVNVMGMTKALQERLLISGQLALPDTRILLVRYGNVMASRGSVIPLFQQQIRNGGPVTITDERMTRFLFTLSDAVDTILAAIATGRPAETFIPEIPSGRILDVARAMIGERRIAIDVIGTRPGEKIHEMLISSEESARAERRGGYFAIGPMLPEISGAPVTGSDQLWEYTSGDAPLDYEGVRRLLARHGLLDLPMATLEHEELLR